MFGIVKTMKTLVLGTAVAATAAAVVPENSPVSPAKLVENVADWIEGARIDFQFQQTPDGKVTGSITHRTEKNHAKR